MIKHALIATALLLPFPLLAGTCNSMNVRLENGYAKTLSNDPMSLVAYITIVNHDFHSHTITGVNSPGASNVNFYGYGGDNVDGTINDIPLEEIQLPPNGGRYEFYPGKSHILLKGYRDLPTPFDSIPLTFTFADGCQITTNDVYIEE